MTNKDLIEKLLQWPGALATDHNGPYVAGLHAIAHPELAALVCERRAELKAWIKGSINPELESG